MGMFDYLYCEYALPDGRDADGIAFQTKDTPSQFLEHYTITKDGRLLLRHVEREWVEEPDSIFGGHLNEVPGTEEMREVEFHGDIEFYTTNVCASGPEGVATEDDNPPFWLIYTVRFTNSRVEWIRGGEKSDVHRGGVRHLTRKEVHALWQREREKKEGRAQRFGED